MDPSVTCAYQQPKLCAVPCSLFGPSRKAAAPDKETVAEELADDVQGLGRWADVCTDPTASKAEVERKQRLWLMRLLKPKS